MSKFLDMILRPEVPSVQAQLPEAEYEIKRLSRLCKEPVTVHLRALPYGKVQDLKETEKERDIMILLAGCKELAAPELREKFGGVTPAETVKAMLLPGEIEDLSRVVERLSGYRQYTIREVKNGFRSEATRS